MLPLILASGSTYRKRLLERLGLPFATCSPNIDESPLAGENAGQLTARLSHDKARALHSRYPRHLIIGSDQVASLDGKIIGKPHDLPHARQQLQAASGRSVTFHTGLSLLNSASGRLQTAVVPFTVNFRPLQPETIERYLTTEQPFDCAGSFKSEGLGVSLLASTQGEDATSLVGLPLIRLVDMLLAEGLQIP